MSALIAAPSACSAAAQPKLRAQHVVALSAPRRANIVLPSSAAGGGGTGAASPASPPPQQRHPQHHPSSSPSPQMHQQHMHPDPSTPIYPGADEERDVSHSAFMHAMEAARPKAMAIPGMQEFAASMWNRRRSIPSTTTAAADPLDRIFSEFDADGDGKLSADEISRALNSRGVGATPQQVQAFIEACDTDDDHLVSRTEFPSFVFHMASADLRSVSRMAAADGGSGGSGGGSGRGSAVPPV